MAWQCQIYIYIYMNFINGSVYSSGMLSICNSNVLSMCNSNVLSVCSSGMLSVCNSSVQQEYA
jgi:hypothetical protein